MKEAIYAVPLALAIASPAQATGGMTCQTAGLKPVKVSLVIGHTAGSPLVSERMLETGKPVPVRSIQWWFDSSELRLLLVDVQAREIRIRTKRSGQNYDGTLVRSGRSRWVRCRES
jgi:hypothetical protein